MAKELPYFKFIATEWMTGNIAFESYELQGLFINVCCIYWQREGVLSISEIEKRYKLKKSLIEDLERYIIIEEDGCIKIKFLDRQFDERGFVSIKNKSNGDKGGRPKALRQFELRFYIIKCFNESESFFKAGITKDSIARRYGSKSGGNNAMPYNYEIVLDEITTSEKGLWLESYLSKNHVKYFPEIKFAGHLECYEVSHKIITEVLIHIKPEKPTGLISVNFKEAKKSNIEEEEEEEEEKEEDIISILFFQITGKKIKINESRRKLINGRMKEGYKTEDFEKVIKTKFTEWSRDEKMKQYLTPETLFAQSNFTKYFEQSQPIKKEAEKREGQILVDGKKVIV